MNPETEDKIRMLRNSMRCFVCGLLGLLPVIGFPFAFAALVLSGKVRGGQREFWNAAKPYWIWGVISALAGTFFWGGVLILIAWRLLMDRYYWAL
jgi:hypothetical protein